MKANGVDTVRGVRDLGTQLLVQAWYPWSSQAAFDLWFKWNLILNRRLRVWDVHFLTSPHLMHAVGRYDGIDSLFSGGAIVPVFRTRERGRDICTFSDLAADFSDNAGFVWGPAGAPESDYVDRLDRTVHQSSMARIDIDANRQNYLKCFEWVLSRWADGLEPYGPELRSEFQKENQSALEWARTLAERPDFRRSTVYQAVKRDEELKPFARTGRLKQAQRLLLKIADDIYLNCAAGSDHPAAYPPNTDIPLWFDAVQATEDSTSTVDEEVFRSIKAIQTALPDTFDKVHAAVANLSIDQIVNLRSAARPFWDKVDDLCLDAKLTYFSDPAALEDLACIGADLMRRIGAVAGVRIDKKSTTGRFVLKWGAIGVAGCGAVASCFGIWMAGAAGSASALYSILVSKAHRIGADADAKKVWRMAREMEVTPSAHYAHHVRLPRPQSRSDEPWAFLETWSGAVPSDAHDASVSVDDAVYGPDRP